MTDLASLLSDFKDSLSCVEQEQKQRDIIMSTQEYKILQAQIDDAEQRQQEMLSVVSDTSEEHLADKEELMQYMLDNGLTQVQEFKAKTRAKRSVDTMAVLRALDGDIDSLMLVSSIKQKDLETFIRDNPLYKRDLRSCIVDEGYTITDIVIS